MMRILFIAVVSLVGVSYAAKTTISDYKDHPCIQSCDANRPMICEYDFTVEYYYTLTKACYDCPFNITDCYRPHCIPADGNPRAVLVVNRLLPGPAIHVCQFDTVVVNVHNKLEGAEGVSIHWHGLLQRGTPHMDGVGMLTQCAIPAHSSFQYKFQVKEAGTYFWHGHSGIQRSDGIFGAFVVRQASQYEVHHGLYDLDLPEHTVLLTDWMLNLTINKFADHHHAGGDNKPASMLINGKGAFNEFYDDNGQKVLTPYEVFNVDVGRRYRFRFISNGVLNCPIQVSIDNHTLKAIASDGSPFKPIDVDSFNIFAGERYDVIVLTDQPIGNYWLRVSGIADCAVKSAKQVAIFRYKGAPETEPSETTLYEDGIRTGKRLNPWNKRGTDNLIHVSQLETLVPADKSLQEIPDKQFYLAMDFERIDSVRFHKPDLYPISAIVTPKQLLSPQINYISTMLPPSPLLSQFNDVPKEMLCNADTVKQNCSEVYCECVHHLKVDLGDTVELFMIDKGKPFKANHPMHLHGHGFRVVGIDRLSESITLEEIKALDQAGNITRNLTAPVLKDTVTVPDGGYSILRFHANNPGFWFFHCHIEFHAEIGMGLFIQVGELSQMTKTPKNFPRCGNWHFTGYEEDETDDNNNNIDNAQALNVSMILMSFMLLVSWASN